MPDFVIERADATRVEVTVTVWIVPGVDPETVISEMDYEFNDDGIVDTEITGYTVQELK